MTAIFQRLKAFLHQFCQEMREELTPWPDPPKSEYLIDPETMEELPPDFDLSGYGRPQRKL